MFQPLSNLPYPVYFVSDIELNKGSYNCRSKVACGGTVGGTEDVQICTRALKEYPNGTLSNLWESR